MASFLVRCACGHQIQARANPLGRSATCPACGNTVVATAENTTPLAEAPPKPGSQAAAPPKETRRIVALDQLRGYAIFSMLFVNYVGQFDCMPWIFKHHKTGFSFADTVAPLFVFVVGMGFRLSMKNRVRKVGPRAARLAAVKRYLALFLVAIAFYGPDVRTDWWDALTHIALAGLLSLPFIDRKAPVRVAAAVGYLALFTALYMGTSYGSSFMLDSMNGGPLGPVSWAFTLLCGTIAYDLLESGDARNALGKSMVAGVALVGLAWLVWYLIPKDWAGYGEQFGPFWPFSKRWCIAPAMLLSAGLCYMTFALFYYLCEVRHFQFPQLSVLGENALIIYLLQYSLMEIHGAYVPESGGVVVALVGFVCMYAFCYLAARKLHNDGVIIKL